MYRLGLIAALPLVVVSLHGVSLRAQLAREAAKTPVIVDQDIGSDIDDAFALAMVTRSKAVELEAVTTVSGDTAARARIAAKLLSVAGMGHVPVAAGAPAPGKAFAQAAWAENFHSPALVTEPAVVLLDRVINQQQGRIVLIALGPLTNVAALLELFPQDKQRIKEIVLMGGLVAHGYEPGSGQIAESNIASDVHAAQVVFGSGVPLLVAPLDVTAATQLTATEQADLFAHHTPLTQALQQLCTLWGQPVPTLHDPTAVALLVHPGLAQTQPLHVTIDAQGMMRVDPTATPNAVVALKMDPALFIQYYQSLFAQP